jgi:ketosteroid isomerase-like protein
MNYPIVQRCMAAALMLTPLAACGSPSDTASQEASATVDKAAIANQVKEVAKAVVTAFNAGEADKAVSFNAPDFIQMFHGQPNADNASNLANTRSQLAESTARLTISDENVDVSQDGDMAVYTSSYIYDFTESSNQELVTELGNWVMIFRRQSDGSMKIYREIVSDTPPAKAPN